MTYSSQSRIKIFFERSHVVIRINPLGDNFGVGVSYLLKRWDFRLRLPLPNDVCRSIFERLATVDADVVVLP